MARREAIRASLISPKSSDSLVSSLTLKSSFGRRFFFFGLAEGECDSFPLPADKSRFFLLAFTTTERLILGRKLRFGGFRFLWSGEISMSRLGLDERPETRPGAVRSSGDGLSTASLRRLGAFLRLAERMEAGRPREIAIGDDLLRSELAISGSFTPLGLFWGDPISDSCSSFIYFCSSLRLIYL